MHNNEALYLFIQVGFMAKEKVREYFRKWNREEDIPEFDVSSGKYD